MNPGFCLGHRNLAELQDRDGDLDAALRSLDRYARACPAEPDADLRRGQVLMKRGDACGAHAAFVSCANKARGSIAGEECERQAALLDGCGDAAGSAEGT